MEILIIVIAICAICILIVCVVGFAQRKISDRNADKTGVENRVFGYYMTKINAETNTYAIYEGTLGLLGPDLSFTLRTGGKVSTITMQAASITKFELTDESESDYRTDYLTEEHDMATFIMHEPSQRIIGNIGGSFFRRVFGNKDWDSASIWAGNFYARHMLKASNKWATYTLELANGTEAWFSYRDTYDNGRLMEDMGRGF